MAKTSANSLISTARASDASPTVQLHPLVLLTISDCITRHTLRRQSGPIAGAILGQRNGQDITMEVAFQAKLMANNAGDAVLDDEWFNKRLEDFKDVHKQPQLDLVGWFTLGPPSGPQRHMLPIHTRISELYIESPILFLFHPSDARSEATAAGKLPLTLYESVYENATGAPDDKDMDVDGAVRSRATRFRELVYTVETDEAEMISVDFVARGGSHAVAGEGSVAPATTPKADSSKVEEAKKIRIYQKEKELTEEESGVLTAEDDEILTTLTAKINAIRMLSRRISLLRTYLASLPSSYLSDPSLPLDPSPNSKHPLPLNHSILRSISAMLARINILAPPDSKAFTLESQQEASDVQLVNLLSSITNSVSAAKELGRKSYIVEAGKNQGRRGISQLMMGGSRESFFDTIPGIGSGSGDFPGKRW